MSRSCEEIDELLAPYALGALTPEERSSLEEHMVGCRRHDEELKGFRSLAARLPAAAEEKEPPARLRARLLAAFDQEARIERAGPLLGGRVLRLPRFPLSKPAFAYGLVAALLLAVIGLAAWNVVLQTGGPEPTVRQVVQGDMRLRVVYLPEEKLAILDVDLPEAPAGRTYQAWGIFDSEPVSLGLLGNRGVAAFPVDLGDAAAVAISIEPAGGSRSPTSEPIVVVEL